jgi:hypothetical protein
MRQAASERPTPRESGKNRGTGMLRAPEVTRIDTNFPAMHHPLKRDHNKVSR